MSLVNSYLGPTSCQSQIGKRSSSGSNDQKSLINSAVGQKHPATLVTQAILMQLQLPPQENAIIAKPV